jgi:methionine-rich copper-binding protein CopC
VPRRLVLAVPLAAAILSPLPAAAHAILLASTPAIGGTAQPGPAVLEFRFNSRIDRARSVLRLTRPDGSRTELPIAAGPGPDILRAAADLVPGAYTLRWQVLAVDGHITRGDVPFTVVPK